MAKKSGSNLIGSWAFLIGLILAILLGIMQVTGLSRGVTILLIIIGIIVGLFNIAEEEVQPFLISGVVLVIVATLGQSVVQSVAMFDRVLQALTLIFVPATIVVALKNVFSLAKN